jgi:hypothetical protein
MMIMMTRFLEGNTQVTSFLVGFKGGGRACSILSVFKTNRLKEQTPHRMEIYLRIIF